jgi:hypothetical protein
MFPGTISCFLVVFIYILWASLLLQKIWDVFGFFCESTACINDRLYDSLAGHCQIFIVLIHVFLIFGIFRRLLPFMYLNFVYKREKVSLCNLYSEFVVKFVYKSFLLLNCNIFT